MILKLQSGGQISGSVPPLVNYTPVMLNTAASQPTSSTPEKKQGTDLADKDILQLLEKLDGLPSDIQIITNQLQNFYIDQSYGGLLGNLQSLETRYLQTLNQMKIANFNKQEYDQAFSEIIKKGGYNEAAIDNLGNIICVNKDGDYVALTPEQYLKQSEYKALTNGEVLQLRAYDINNAFKGNLTHIVKNGVGMDYINDYIQQIIQGLGTNTISTTGYSGKQGEKILSGIEILKDALNKGTLYSNADNLSVDGLYKNSLITKDQSEQIRMSLNYIYSTLPENAKSLLKLKAGNNNQRVEDLLISLIGSKSTSYVSFDAQLQGDLNPDGSKKKTSSSKEEKDNSDKINSAVAFQIDKGIPSKLKFKTESGFEFETEATMLPSLNKEGNSTGITTLENMANTSTLGGIFNFNQITVGNQVVDMSSTPNILVNSNQVYKAYLPIDKEKEAQGIITPDLDVLETLSLIEQDIKETGASTPEEINKIYESYALPDFFNPDGSYNEAYYKPFGIMQSSVLSDAFSSDTDLRDNRYFQEITDENEINNLWRMLKGQNTKETFDDRGAWDAFVEFFGGKGTYQSLYKGLVFLPIVSVDPTLGTYSGGDTPTLNQLNNYRELVQQEQRISNFKPQGQLEL